ncbi:MAG TPA: YeeE/YedE thiosulfate transporter family protein [Symbiobacteriaceae bacterium]|nr:YeeE/YedE thiosulfate transporter family protein [Symbiobacteriaceae bacterium]
MTPSLYAGMVLLSGLLAGFAFQRSRLCFVSSMRDVFLFGAAGMTRAILLLLTITSAAGGLITYWRQQAALPVPAAWGPPLGSLLLGGLLFGVGMVLAGSCLAGALWRLGEGYWSQLWILGGVFTGTWLYELLPRLAHTDPPLALPGWLATVVLVAVIVAIVVWERRRSFPGEEMPAPRGPQVWRAPWSPDVGALVIAATLVGFLALTGKTWRVSRVFRLDDLDSAAFAVGLLVGGLAGSVWGREWRSRAAGGWPQRALRFGGGLLMGLGARYGWGCTVGALLSGTVLPIAQPWLWLAGAVAGVWVGVAILRRWPRVML